MFECDAVKATRAYTMSNRADGVAATRDRIVRAAMGLFFEQAYEDVTLSAIAEAAGVSHQTVLNHFESKVGVVLAVAEVLAEETVERRARADPGDVKGAVHALVGEYERFGDSNARWAMTAERVPELGPLMDHARATHQAWLEHMFAGDLPATPAARRRAIVALHAATDVYTWKLLRRDLRLSRADTERTMTDLVTARLSAGESRHA